MVIRNEGEEFLREKGDQRGGSLWKSQHLLQHRQHALPAKTPTTISLNKLRPPPFANCTALFVASPAALFIGVQTPDEMDKLLRDELLGHDQLQLVEVRSLFL